MFNKLQVAIYEIQVKK